MSTAVRMWMVPDAADLARVAEFGGVGLGDLLFEFDNNTLWVIHATGIQPVGSSPTNVTTATISKAGTVKQMTHINQLVAAPTMADFNNLLTKLQAAGISA